MLFLHAVLPAEAKSWEIPKSEWLEWIDCLRTCFMPACKQRDFGLCEGFFRSWERCVKEHDGVSFQLPKGIFDREKFASTLSVYCSEFPNWVSGNKNRFCRKRWLRAAISTMILPRHKVSAGADSLTSLSLAESHYAAEISSFFCSNKDLSQRFTQYAWNACMTQRHRQFFS